LVFPEKNQKQIKIIKVFQIMFIEFQK
jgi:hypothetical protein